MMSNTQWPSRLDGPGAWTRESLDQNRDWMHDFEPESIPQIDAAIEAMRRERAALESIAPFSRIATVRAPVPAFAGDWVREQLHATVRAAGL